MCVAGARFGTGRGGKTTHWGSYAFSPSATWFSGMGLRSSVLAPSTITPALQKVKDRPEVQFSSSVFVSSC